MLGIPYVRCIPVITRREFGSRQSRYSSLISLITKCFGYSSPVITAITGVSAEEPTFDVPFELGIDPDVFSAAVPIAATTDPCEVAHRVVYGCHRNFVVAVAVCAAFSAVSYVLATPILRKMTRAWDAGKKRVGKRF